MSDEIKEHSPADESRGYLLNILSHKEKRHHLAQAIGPGILMAGAAIGGSHLVSSTQAGARYGWSLLGLLLLVNLFKYPFFLYCQRYAAATGESVLHGFKRMGKAYILAYFLLNIVNGFLNITGVAMVTASLSMNFGIDGAGWSLSTLCVGFVAVCALIVIVGRYRALDRIAKTVILILAISTIIAVLAAAFQYQPAPTGAAPSSPWTWSAFGFIILFMGWMPAPIDIAVWPSLWTPARERETGHKVNIKEAMIDFHIGYIGTVFLALCFLALGAMVLQGSDQDFASLTGSEFAAQLIGMYTEAIGPWAHGLIAVAAFTTMFSTTLTCVDAYPRCLATCSNLLRSTPSDSQGTLRRWHIGWVFASLLASTILTTFFLSDLMSMIKVAMVISFLTSPFFAWMHTRIILQEWVPASAQPGKAMRALSGLGMAFFVILTLAYIYWKWIAGE